MKALVLEKTKQLSLRDIVIPEEMGPDDVRIAIHTVGICGSDVHYYQHGAIGDFVVREPMVLGHEASGKVIESGSKVKHLQPGDRVCMEPGIPDPNSKASRLGLYNLDPAVRFWATPPDHGCLRTLVVHPAAFTYKLPETVSYGEGAMVEPLAVGMHAAKKARITPGDIAVVIGAGTIGIMTALAALAGGCSRVIISDIVQEKLDIGARFGSITPVNVTQENLSDVVDSITGGWGADIVFEVSGHEQALKECIGVLCPGGCVVIIGLPVTPPPFDIGEAHAKEPRIEMVFRYANVYARAFALLGSGKIDLKPLITETFPFEDSIAAFDYVSNPKPTTVKAQIVLEN